MDFDPLIEGDLPPRAEAVIFPWKWPSHLICTVSLRLTDIKGTIEVRARSKALFLPDVELSVVDARRKWGGP